MTIMKVLYIVLLSGIITGSIVEAGIEKRAKDSRRAFSAAGHRKNTKVRIKKAKKRIIHKKIQELRGMRLGCMKSHRDLFGQAMDNVINQAIPTHEVLGFCCTILEKYTQEYDATHMSIDEDLSSSSGHTIVAPLLLSHEYTDITCGLEYLLEVLKPLHAIPVTEEFLEMCTLAALCSIDHIIIIDDENSNDMRRTAYELFYYLISHNHVQFYPLIMATFARFGIATEDDDEYSYPSYEVEIELVNLLVTKGCITERQRQELLASNSTSSSA